MDVRCEKCQTEYELDESRLKPGGVTVKCTNCGHMFKIRRRANTNVGIPAAPAPEQRTKPISSRPPVTHSSATAVAPAPTSRDDAAPQAPASDLGNAERQWLIRLENGDQKSCRELATLQQWIVAGIVSRESLISRTGKTWKRLGDIPELGQYFLIAEEARAQRSAKPTGSGKPGSSTVLGMGRADDDLEGRSTGNYRARPPTPPPPPPVRPSGSPPPRPSSPPSAVAATELAPTTGPGAPRRPPTQPPPPPRPKAPSADRNTAGWAAADIRASDSMVAMPQGPMGGKLSAIPAEPAFAGRVRVQPADESSFETGKVKFPDDEEDVVPSRGGSRAGTWIAILSLLVIAGAAAVVYLFAFRNKTPAVVEKAPADAAAVAVKAADAAPIVTPLVDAPPALTPVESARAELASDVEARMKSAFDAIAKMDDPAAMAVRSQLVTTIAQSMQDRAGLVEKAEGDKLRKDAKQLLVEAATLATKAQKALADDPNANLAMADVLRMQGKPAKDVRRYLETAKSKVGSDKELARSVALSDALVFVRDGKLDDAAKALAAIDAGSDARVLIASALVATAQNKPDAAKPLVDQILTGQPDHDVARALQAKLATTVAKTDPMPQEDHGSGSAAPKPPVGPTPQPNNAGGGGGDYDSLVARANKLAEANCTKAMELYQKALEVKAQGVEALTGMGYCHLDAKQFASAFSNFRSALVVAPKFEPALGGIAETYQRQGNKEQAIESWKKYLEVFPGSAKAKKQLDMLGAGEAPAPAPAPTPAPAPAPTPAPAPAPAPEGSGAGSN